MNNKNISLNNQNYIIIRNSLRTLGIKVSNRSGAILITAIQYAIEIYSNTTDSILLAKTLYQYVAKYYKISESKVKNNINYALQNRNIFKSEENFNKIFSFNYDEYLFTNKTFIEEFINNLTLKSF